MDNSIIGAQITKFRKAANLTQEELGRSVGVSTQAVSRWECGGTPDISLLPAIADRLGVDINALFGREGGQTQDIPRLVRRWTYEMPKEQVIEKMNRLVWSAVSQLPFEGYEENPMPYMTTCENSFNRHEGLLTYSAVAAEQGLYFGIAAEDMSFSILCPKPEQGYSAYFEDRDKLRQTFSILAMPGCLEVTEYMLSNPGNYSAEVLAQAIGMEKAQMEALLGKMAEGGLVESQTVNLMEGKTDIFCADNYTSYIPFMYLARYIGQENKINYMNVWIGGIPTL